MSSKAEGGLRWRRWLLRAHISLVATLIPLADNFLSLKELMRLLAPPRWWRPYRGTSAEEVLALVSRRLENPRNMRRRSCLRHGLTLFHFLKLAGYAPVLQIGVFPPAPGAARMLAHCWVTLDGVCLCSPPDQPTAVVVRHGGDGGMISEESS